MHLLLLFPASDECNNTYSPDESVCTSLYLNPTLLNQPWDVVIIDEGSMAPPPAVMIAAQLAGAHVIVVGDPLQLAPVCKLKDPLLKPWQKDQDIVQRWLGRDVFYHGGYTLQQAGAGIPS